MCCLEVTDAYMHRVGFDDVHCGCAGVHHKPCTKTFSEFNAAAHPPRASECLQLDALGLRGTFMMIQAQLGVHSWQRSASEMGQMFNGIYLKKKFHVPFGKSCSGELGS